MVLFFWRVALLFQVYKDPNYIPAIAWIEAPLFALLLGHLGLRPFYGPGAVTLWGT